MKIMTSQGPEVLQQKRHLEYFTQLIFCVLTQVYPIILNTDPKLSGHAVCYLQIPVKLLFLVLESGTSMTTFEDKKISMKSVCTL